MSFDWKETLRAVAPALAAAFGGPLAGTAVKVLGDKLLGKPDASEADLQPVIANASPEVLAKLREIDNEFAEHMKALDVDLERISAADRDSARKREVEVKDYIPAVLAIGVTLGFFAVLFFLLRVGLPKEGGEAMLIMLGSLGTAWTGVIAYYFGSSAGSSKKDVILGKIASAP